MIALPVALYLTALTKVAERPVLEGMDMLSVLLSAGQLLALPLVISLVVKPGYTEAPLAMVIVVVVHFAPYSWLYATPLYLVMGAAVAIGVAAVVGIAGTADQSDEQRSINQAGRACLVTGSVLVAWFLRPCLKAEVQR